MILIGITAILVAALVINHAVHGLGCWGLQPGGPISAMIYDVQILTCVVGVLWLIGALSRKTVPHDTLQIVGIGFFVLASVGLYMVFGWRAHTSIHRQGPENLIAYLTVAATTYLVGRYLRQRDGNDAGSESDSVAPPNLDQIDRPATDNPYEPPQSLA
jgi:hypothetical protein